MKQNEDSNELFQAAHLTILLTYSVFSIVLIFESLLMNWEIWPLFVIAGGVVFSWVLHISNSINEKNRIWIYSCLTMFAFFFYGSHITSVFDTVAVMSVILILYTMTGMKNLITFLQIIYYITLAYGLGLLWQEGTAFDSLIISRSILHFIVVTFISCISRIIIDKWTFVLNRSKNEIENLTDATDRLNDFLANVSHEIRTPVNAVIGLTSICIDEENDAEKLANLSAVRDAGRRVAEQIGDILDYSEIDRNKLTNNMEDYILSSVLNDLVSELKPYRTENIELIIDVDPTIPSVLHSDVTKIKKILRHLIMNGIKYTREGGVYVRISMEKEPYGINLLIEVTDTGIGMTEAEIEKVFVRFFQADSGRTRQGSGLGIGMSIVYGFVSSLGGFMMVNSKINEGTTVKVSIPHKVIDPASCMSVNYRNSLCLGAYLHFDKFENPSVREYYNNVVHNIVNGLGVQMHRVDNVENLKKLTETVRLTHLFVGEEEYLAAKDYLENLLSNTVIIVVAGSDFVLPSNSRARIMEKPFYCFPVVTILNSDADSDDTIETSMYCRGVRALVVDDEPMNLTVARNIFNRYGMIVTTATSGQEAIDLCREKDFDIVFMDHMMPGMDGVEAMKRISVERAKMRSYIPMVALTANAVSTAKEMFLSEGFDGFVSKPIELVELERVIKKVLPHNMITYETNEIVSDGDIGTDITTVNDTVKNTAENSSENNTYVVDFEPVDKQGGKVPCDQYQSSDMITNLKKIGIDTETGLKYCMNEEDFYKTVILEYVADSDNKRNSLNKFFKEEDFNNYRIVIHALKSTSQMIGALDLYSEAKMLEGAAKEGNSDYIKKNHLRVYDMYEKLTSNLSILLKE
ncbi:MAG: response regulator [Lachnospiraceae bacterium]|nr:response regulator [Lachnospiraceae bacterium]